MPTSRSPLGRYVCSGVEPNKKGGYTVQSGERREDRAEKRAERARWEAVEGERRDRRGVGEMSREKRW